MSSTRAVDPDPHSFSLLDPYPGGHFCRKKRKKWKEIRSTCDLIFKNLTEFGPVPWFLTFEQPFFVFQPQKTLQKVICYNFFMLDPDPH